MVLVCTAPLNLRAFLRLVGAGRSRIGILVVVLCSRCCCRSTVTTIVMWVSIPVVSALILLILWALALSMMTSFVFCLIVGMVGRPVEVRLLTQSWLRTTIGGRILGTVEDVSRVGTRGLSLNIRGWLAVRLAVIVVNLILRLLTCLACRTDSSALILALREIRFGDCIEFSLCASYPLFIRRSTLTRFYMHVT